MREKFLKRAAACVCVAAVLAGCSTGASSNANATGTSNAQTSANNIEATQSTTQSVTEVVTEKNLTEGEKLAEKYNGFVETPMDLGGREIKFVSSTASRYKYATNSDGSENKEGTPNDTLKVIEAIESIEKDYNCKITFEQLKGSKVAETYLTALAAGDVYSDIGEWGVSDIYLDQLYSNNLILPLDDTQVSEIIKLDTNPWHSASDFGKMFGHQYGVHFKTLNSGDLLRGVCLFNKELAKKYELGDLYKMVENKEWTFEKFQEICAKIASSSGGEVYPITYLTESLFAPLFVYSNGGTVCEVDEVTGKYKYTAIQDNTLYAFNYLVDFSKNGYIHPYSEQKNSKERAALTSKYAVGEAVFMFTTYATLKNFKTGAVETEFEYGLLPAPIGPSGDGNYSSVTYTENLFHIVKGAKKPEELAAVIVAFANRTSKDYDLMIEDELMYTLYDEESADMLQMMYKNTYADVSRTAKDSRGAISPAIKKMFTLEKTPKEALEEIETTMTSVFDNLVLQEN